MTVIHRPVRPDRKGPRQGKTTYHAVLALALGVGVWAVLVPRMIPTSIDHGIFISVAERLLAGDRLYADVWDNKDPLIFYLLALGRWFTPYASLVIELLWLVLAAGSVTATGRWAGQRPEAALFAGFVLTPIVLTGSAYLAGYTHLPGTALSLAVLAAALHRRRFVTGLLLAALAFTKGVMLPFAVVFLLLARRADKRGWELPTTEVLVALAASAVLGGAMTIRGEFAAFVTVQEGNVLYARGPLVGSELESTIDHLRAVLGPGEVTTLLAVTLVLVLGWSLLRAQAADADQRLWLIWTVTVAALALAVLSTALIGLWGHHGQVFYPAGALAALLVTALLTRFAGSFLSGGAMLAALITVVLLAGVPTVNAETYVRGVVGAGENLAQLATASDQSRAVQDSGPVGSYARLGVGETPPGHAAGLGDWDLECRRFHQYWFQSPEAFDEVLTCVRGADVVLVDTINEDLRNIPGWPDWTAFVAASREIIASDFQCTPHEWGELCVRID